MVEKSRVTSPIYPTRAGALTTANATSPKTPRGARSISWRPSPNGRIVAEKWADSPAGLDQ